MRRCPHGGGSSTTQPIRVPLGLCTGLGPWQGRSFLPRAPNALMVLRVAWVCRAASLPSSADCNVIRKKKGENGLFLLKSFASSKAEGKQIRNNHRTENKYLVV